MNKRLVLRPLPMIVLAYAAAAIAAPAVLWLVLDWRQLLSADAYTRKLALADLDNIMRFGAPVCLVGELVVVTPLLIAFNRYRWSWLTGWTAPPIAYGLCFLVALATSIPGLIQSPPPPGSNTASALLAFCALASLVGPVGALIFRLLAVHAVPGAPPPA